MTKSGRDGPDGLPADLAAVYPPQESRRARGKRAVRDQIPVNIYCIGICLPCLLVPAEAKPADMEFIGELKINNLRKC